MAGGKKKKTQFVGLPEVEESLQAGSSISSLEPALNANKVGKKKKSRKFDASNPSTFFSAADATHATAPFSRRSLGRINEPAVFKQSRRRRDSDPALFDEGQDGMDLDADFIAKFDSLIDSSSKEAKPNAIDPLQESHTPVSYAKAANTTSTGGNLAVYDLCPAAMPSAETPAADRDKKTTTIIGRDMNVSKKLKRARGQKNAGKPTGISQQFKNQKKRTVLRLEDDVDRGLSVTGHRRWNVKKFNEHWEEALPVYYKYRKDGE